MDIDADFELLGEQFDFLNDEKNDLLTEHNYAKQPQADDVHKYEQEQFFEHVDADFFVEEIDPGILHYLFSTELKEEDKDFRSEAKSESHSETELPPTSERSRYFELDEEGLNNLADANSEINTKHQTKWAVNIFKGSFPNSMEFLFFFYVSDKKNIQIIYFPPGILHFKIL